MTVTMTLEEYYELRKLAITPEQWKAKRERIIKAGKAFVAQLPHHGDFYPGTATQQFINVVVSILEPEGDNDPKKT